VVLPAKELPLFSVPPEVGPIQAFVKRPLQNDGQVQIHGNLKLPQFRSLSFTHQNYFNFVLLHIKTVLLFSYKTGPKIELLFLSSMFVPKL
jgi:hypothetical protein